MVRVLVIGFTQNILGCDYYVNHPFALWELYVIALFYVIYLLY